MCNNVLPKHPPIVITEAADMRSRAGRTVGKKNNIKGYFFFHIISAAASDKLNTGTHI